MEEQFDKSEQATPYKLREAKKKGQIAKSQEFPAFFSLLAIVVVLYVFGSELVRTSLRLLALWIGNAHQMAESDAMLMHNFFGITGALSFFWLIAVAASFIAVVAISFVYGGVALSFFPIKPNFSKLNPAKGFKKIFSKRSLVELVKLIVKLTVFSTVVYLVLKPSYLTLLSNTQASLNHVLASWNDILVKLVVSLLVVFAIFALFDLWYSKFEFAKQMRMSKRDVKDEHKKREGNPEVKAKIKKNQNELLAKLSNIQNIGDADVIITNPTHIAVALKFRPQSMAVPIVLTKGSGMIAKIICRQARKHQVPILRKKMLARKLNKLVKVGMPIKDDQQLEVAKVYSWVVTMSNHKVYS
ncbi:EscU/YscU/HrcU family type III secretion system export apparatus switch protein [Catenovulum sediminis]|uniref:EscU/YscU/HrcU family type III secretion system export apparatus switch protein n=1 Tax=Catenovulum sediminis TaxID=1740262 RepID=UPI00117FD253|nr:EscU/YscU/HrcU family type III secretion system export apparatus switch protein [Catenovulum sediminis]